MENIRTYAGTQKRAFNLIWTAAEDYTFHPPFVALLQDGQPDVYLNSIIGYIHKWYDFSILAPFFETLQTSFFRETLEGLSFITLEDCAYQKESPLRPVLKELREEYAHRFFLQESSMSRQQWMAANSLVYALQSARCRQILGKETGLIIPWEKSLFLALSGDASWSAQEITSHLFEVFRKYFHFHASSRHPSLLTNFWRHLPHLIESKKAPIKLLRTESMLTFPRSSGSAAGSLSPSASRGFRSSIHSRDLKYIKECFGPSIFSDIEQENIEKRLCRDAHKNCHLYFAEGELPSSPAFDSQAVKFREDAKAQTRKNLAHFRSRRQFYHTCIQKIREQIQNALLVCPQPLHVQNRTGKLSPSRIWRGLYLNDPFIFTSPLPKPSANFSVDLMLDASASRMENQELIAAQGYLIARSLRLSQIPVQVFSYFSTRGYTVLRRFCTYESSDDPSSILGYFAAGWNRDGLALRAAGCLMENAPGKNRLLIILTDASPNDDRIIPAGASKNHLTGRDYSGQAGIDDTALEVRKLRRQGTTVCAILTGDDGNTKAAKEIFGSDFVRIEKMEHFGNAAGTLIRRQIRKLTGA